MIPRELLIQLEFKQIGPAEGDGAWKVEVWFSMKYDVWVHYETPENGGAGYDARKGSVKDFLLWYIKEIEEHHQTEWYETHGEN